MSSGTSSISHVSAPADSGFKFRMAHQFYIALSFCLVVIIAVLMSSFILLEGVGFFL